MHRAQKYSPFLSTTTTEPPNITEYFESEDETTTENFLETTTEFDAPETTTIQITTTTTTTKSPKLKKKLKRKRKKKQKTCHAQGVWKHSAGFDDWCNLNCNHRPAYCPKSHCKCD